MNKPLIVSYAFFWFRDYLGHFLFSSSIRCFDFSESKTVSNFGSDCFCRMLASLQQAGSCSYCAQFQYDENAATWFPPWISSGSLSFTRRRPQGRLRLYPRSKSFSEYCLYVIAFSPDDQGYCLIMLKHEYFFQKVHINLFKVDDYDD